MDESYRARINNFIRKQVAEGHQCYVVCPAVAEAMVRANINEVYYMQIPNMEALHNVMCS